MTCNHPARRPLSERVTPSSSITLPKPRPLAVAVHAALLSLALGTADLIIPPADAPVAAPTRKTYSLPPGPLEDALNRFAQQAGVLLSFDPTLVLLAGAATAAFAARRLQRPAPVTRPVGATEDDTSEQIAFHGVGRA